MGKVTALVKPAERAVSRRRSVVLIRSAARCQLVFEGRSSGPRAGGAALGSGVVAGAVRGVAEPRPAVGVVAGAASLGNAPVRQRVDEARVDGEALAFHHPGVLGHIDVLSRRPAIRPLRTTTVAFLRIGPLTEVTTRALRSGQRAADRRRRGQEQGQQ